MKISGQDFWTGINPHLRAKIAKELKKYFYERLKNFKPLSAADYPIGIAIDIYDTLDHADIDNWIYIYRKTLHDALCGNVDFVKDKEGKFHPDRENYPAIIIDDDLVHVRQITTSFYPIDNHDDNTMIITIYKL